MKIYAFTLLLGLTPCLAEDCTFNQDHQIEVLRDAAKLHGGGEVRDNDHQVIWKPGEGSTDTFSYGGCADLGGSVSRSTPRSQARSRDETLTLARALVLRYAPEMTVATVLKQLDLENAKSTPTEAGERFDLTAPELAELTIEHRYAEGTDQVSVLWQEAL